MPPVKVIVVIAGLIALGLATGNFQFRWWTSSGASNVPAAKDVNRVVDALHDVRLDASYQNLAHMIDGINVRRQDGLAVLKFQVSGVAARMAEDSDAARLRVAAVDVDTETGRRLRAVVARAFLAQKLMFRDLSAGVVRRRTAEASVRRWMQRYDELHAWFQVQLSGVLGQTPYEDLPAVEAALNRL